MKLNIQAVNFEMAKQLDEFIGKKTKHFAKLLREEDEMEVRMTVLNPATNLNKETQVKVVGLFAEKTCDTFEEGLMAALNAIEKQLEKRNAMLH